MRFVCLHCRVVYDVELFQWDALFGRFLEMHHQHVKGWEGSQWLGFEQRGWGTFQREPKSMTCKAAMSDLISRWPTWFTIKVRR
jgi:hypothetical protein